MGNQFLMLLPETNAEQAKVMARRLQSVVANELGIQMQTETYSFGVDELTLSGVLDRLYMQSLEHERPRMPAAFEIRPRKQSGPSLLNPASAS